MEQYDFSYIDDKIIGGIEKNLPNVQEILRYVEIKATGKVAASQSQGGASVGAISDSQSNLTSNRPTTKEGDGLGETPGEIIKKVTVFREFNLSVSKPREIVKEEEVVREIKANPVPHHIFKKTLSEVEKEKEERRLATVNAVKKGYEESKVKEFDL